MSRVAIVGSREFVGLDAVTAYVKKLPDDTVVITGGAPGVDSRAERVAKKRGLKVVVIPFDWALKRGLTDNPKVAGLMRNDVIARKADKMVAWWNGWSTGTMHAIKCMIARQKSVRVFPDLGRDWRKK